MARPVMAPQIFGPGVECTIGSDEETARAIEAMGGRHRRCRVDEVCVDQQRSLVTTPAYMLAESIGQAAQGIRLLVDEVLARVAGS